MVADVSISPPAKIDRLANLDLLRSIAILLVIFYHTQMFEPWKGVQLLSSMQGWWSGVDLFFVLSGYLIGGLYWRELKKFGNVEIKRFWVRRWLRTIPPYLVALHLAYSAKYIFGDHSLDYDIRYLFFLQNYTGISYFGLSWSLCIEEHFYLLLPIVLLGAQYLGKRIHVLFCILFLVPIISRILTTVDGAPIFGLHYTATHNHLEGLVLGVWAAYIYCFQSNIWDRIVRVCRLLVIPALVFILTLELLNLPLDFKNRFLFTILALCFAIILVSVATMRPLLFATSRANKVIAMSSYSIYLTHSLVLHTYIATLTQWFHNWNAYVHLALVVLLILVVGYIFAQALEITSIAVRDRYMPRRQ